MEKVIFIFPSSPKKIQILSDPETPIASIKSVLLSENWPEDFTPPEKIQHLRFFCMGKELHDSSTLSSVKRPDEGSAFPIHVQIVKTSPNSSASFSNSNWCCSCTLV